MNSALRHMDRAEWQATARRFLDYNYRQMWEFGVACAERIGAVSEHVAVEDGGEIVGLADVRIKRIPGLGTGIAYVNGGPLVRRGDGRDSDRLSRSMKALIEEYANRRGMVLRVMAPVDGGPWNDAQRVVLSDAGFASS
ncbi:MAG: hypothetical protein ABFE01_21045, partial [Phycisphaerales bacterium]